jgi:hypothetical protein
MSIWEWVKLIATAIAISVAMTAVGAGAVLLIAKYTSVSGLFHFKPSVHWRMFGTKWTGPGGLVMSAASF